MAEYVNQFVYIPKFEHPDVSGVTFGGFLAGKYEASQPNATPDDDNPDVADSANPGACPAITQPGVAPWRYINYNYARKAAANLGLGFHLMTAFEWAALVLWSQANGTMPHGNNGNNNPPRDGEYTSEIAILDRAAYARDVTYLAALTGTGPNTWAHNHQADGVFDLNGNMWQWTDGLMLCPASLNDDSATPHAITGAGGAGYPLVLASLDVTLAGAPYGKSTATGAGSLADSNKAWTVNEFAGCFLYDAAGDLFYVDSNTATALTIDGGNTPVAGAYTVLKVVATNITSGITTDNRILTLRNADADLKPFAIPATSDATGSDTYGKDGYWFEVTALQAAIRGGNWDSGVEAGVFALHLGPAPSTVGSTLGLRVAKSL